MGPEAGRGLRRKQCVPLAHKPLLRMLYVPGWLLSPAGELGRETDHSFPGAQPNNYRHRINRAAADKHSLPWSLGEALRRW